MLMGTLEHMDSGHKQVRLDIMVAMDDPIQCAGIFHEMP